MRRLLSSLALGAVVVGVYAAGALEPLERQSFDARFRLLPREAGGGVVVVAIDPESLRVLDVWPWARGYHATVLENLLAAGAARVAFDIDFSSRSEPDEDRELAAALAAAGTRAVLPAFRQPERTADGGLRLAATLPREAFRRHATLATINVRPDGDGLLRRYRVGDELDGRRVPSIAAVLADTPDPGFDSFYLDFGIAPASIPRLPYVAVLTGQFDPEAVRGKAVIVGGTAVEMGDVVAVPVHASLPGPVVQALGYECLSGGRALRRLPFALVVALTLLAALAGQAVFGHRSWRRDLPACVALIAGVFVAAVALQAAAPLLLDVAPPVAAIAASFAVATARNLDRQGLRLVLQALRLRRTETLMRHVVEHSFDAIVTTDDEGRIVTLNPAARWLFRLGDGGIGRPVDELLAGERQALEAGRVLEVTARRADGTEFPAELLARAIDGDDRGRRVWFVRDITERRAHERVLRHQATHDSLTRLPNRVLLRERTRAALEAAERGEAAAAFMVLDLEKFKDINNSLGHQVGDVLLRRIGARLAGVVTDAETVARFGGDEFAVVCPGADRAAASALARRLIAAVAEPLQIEELSLHVGASVGIALFPEHGRGAEELIQRADVAMYVAKRGRMDVALYHPDHDFTSRRNLALSGELRQAIPRDELVLYYQPKVCCETEKLAGVEALVRWNHPEHGLIPPGEFIELAEHSGIIGPLAEWVIDAALRQCLAWHRRGWSIGVAVNLSARNLHDAALPDRVARLLSELGLPPGLVTLEITESVIMEDPRVAMEVVTRFAELGVRIAIDDFGTGYSSLAYLKRLPAREIKIDRAFVSELDRNRDDAVIVRSTIEMAHNLGLSVVGEGIESEAVWNELRRAGCNVGQGYFFSRPLALDDFMDWLAASRWKPLRDPEEGSPPATSVA